MKQLTQKLKSGKMMILEVPIPDLNRSNVVVRNFYSLISAGTDEPLREEGWIPSESGMDGWMDG